MLGLVSVTGDVSPLKGRKLITDYKILTGALEQVVGLHLLFNFFSVNNFKKKI